MPQAKEKIQRLKAVSTYLQSPEIRSSSSSCVDTSKQQQQPATKLCQSTKCKNTKYSTLSTIFSFENYTKLRSRASACNSRKKPELQNSHKIVKKLRKSTKIFFGASRKPPLCKWELTARERGGGAAKATRMKLGMEPGMELGIERDRVKRSRKDIFLEGFFGGEIFESGTFRSFVNSIKGGLLLVQNLNSSVHWCLK